MNIEELVSHLLQDQEPNIEYGIKFVKLPDNRIGLIVYKIEITESILIWD